MVHRAPPVPPVLCSGTLGNSVSLYVKHLNTLHPYVLCVLCVLCRAFPVPSGLYAASRMCS